MRSATITSNKNPWIDKWRIVCHVWLGGDDNCSIWKLVKLHARSAFPHFNIHFSRLQSRRSWSKQSLSHSTRNSFSLGMAVVTCSVCLLVLILIFVVNEFVVNDSVLGKDGIVGHVHGVSSKSGQTMVGHGPD